MPCNDVLVYQVQSHGSTPQEGVRDASPSAMDLAGLGDVDQQMSQDF